MANKFGLTGSSTALIQFATGLQTRLYLLSTILGTALVSISGAYMGTYSFLAEWAAVSSFFPALHSILFNPYVACGIGILLTGFGLFGSNSDQTLLKAENESLKRDVQNTQALRESLEQALQNCEILHDEKNGIHKKLVKTWLKGVSKETKLTTNERVTVYYTYKNQFYLLARYSANPFLDAEHRQAFPLNQGVISKAWQHKELVDIQNCPAFSEDARQAYNAYQLRVYAYDEEKLQSLTMKSCSYFGLAIVDADQHIGVILFESQNKETLTADLVSEIRKYCTNYQSHLAEFVRDAIKYDRTTQEQKVSVPPEDSLLRELDAKGAA